MFDYMVNPSDAPKKSKRRNPELLIVNPYSLGEEREEQKKRAKMAKKNRRNPLARRRNPSLASIKADFLDSKKCGDDGRVTFEEWGNVKNAVVGAAAGGFALAVGSALIGAKFGDSPVGKGALAIVSGVVGGVVAKAVGDKMGVKFISDLAVPGATGAMMLGLWSLIQKPVEDAASSALKSANLAGFNAWTKEFDTPGLSGLGQSYYDEFTKGVAPGMNGLGQPVVAASDLSDPSHNPFLNGYEPMGDIVNSQRLGAFEAESGLGGFVAENANPRDQQVADVMKNASGAYGGYEGPFDPFIES